MNTVWDWLNETVIINLHSHLPTGEHTGGYMCIAYARITSVNVNAAALLVPRLRISAYWHETSRNNKLMCTTIDCTFTYISMRTSQTKYQIILMIAFVYWLLPRAMYTLFIIVAQFSFLATDILCIPLYRNSVDSYKTYNNIVIVVLLLCFPSIIL